MAERPGVSRRTVYRRPARYRQGHAAALAKHGPRPQRSHRRLGEEVLRRVQGPRQGRQNSLQMSIFLSLPLAWTTLTLRRSGPETADL
ncbi:MAG: hypothetical protein C4525_05130 [Desulfarculus sp.]|nr:MAG: hypothetical protein C4525_05130 [Desulfarculus sp.]